MLRSENNKVLLVFISRVHKSFHGGVALEPGLHRKMGGQGGEQVWQEVGYKGSEKRGRPK